MDHCQQAQKTLRNNSLTRENDSKSNLEKSEELLWEVGLCDEQGLAELQGSQKKAIIWELAERVSFRYINLLTVKYTCEQHYAQNP